MSSPDAVAFVQAFRRPAVDPDGEPIAVAPGVDLHAIANKPGDPGWASKIPPGEKDGSQNGAEESAPVPSSAPAGAFPAPAGARRLVVSFSRKEDRIVADVEEAPDWEIVESYEVPLDAVAWMLPILSDLNIKVKDRTRGDLTARRIEMEEPS